MGYFVEAVAIGAELADGFRLGDLAFAPAAWQRVDGVGDTFGWVCLLHDGRRAYLQYTGRRGSWPVSARTWPCGRSGPGEELPAVDDPAVHWFEPRHVNQALALFQAAPGDRALPPRPPAPARPSSFARYRARARQLREEAETADAAPAFPCCATPTFWNAWPTWWTDIARRRKIKW